MANTYHAFLVPPLLQASLETLPHTASSKLQGLVSLLEAAPAQISLPNAALHVCVVGCTAVALSHVDAHS